MSTKIVTWDDYQAAAMLTRLYPRITGKDGQALPVYPALAAMGEVAEFIEKVFRTMEAREAQLKELGDVLWYITAASVDLGCSLGDLHWASYYKHMQYAGEFALWSSLTHPQWMDHYAKGLTVHLGTFSEIVKKAWRDQTPLDTEHCLFQLSKALRALTGCARALDSHLGEVAQLNIDKLTSRRERGVVHGSGDNR